MDINYIKASDVKAFSFPCNYRQSWDHDFNINKLKVDWVYINNFSSDKNKDTFSESVDILEFLYKYKFATKFQLELIVSINGHDRSKVSGIVDSFVKERILNAFTLAEEPMERLPNDAYTIYTIDFGGKIILTHFGRRGNDEWRISDVLYHPERIAGFLAANQFLLSLRNNLGEKVKLLRVNSKYEFKEKNSLRTTASFKIVRDLEEGEYILDTYRKDDVPILVSDKADLIEYFYGGNYLKKYFDKKPVMLVLCENLEDVHIVAKRYYAICPEVPVRYLTDESISNGINQYSFFKYNGEEDKLVNVKSSMFV